MSERCYKRIEKLEEKTNVYRLYGALKNVMPRFNQLGKL